MKDDRIYLVHMLDTARKISARMSGTTRAQFDADEDLKFAMAHLLQMIGEAARLVEEDTRQAGRQIPWDMITGMRHRLVHDYLNVDFNIVWDTATVGISQLIPQLEYMLAALGKPEE